LCCRCTTAVPFIIIEGREPVAHSAWARAVQCFVGGLLGQHPVTVEKLTQRSKLHDAKIQQQLDQLAQEAQGRNKRHKSPGS